LYQNKKAAYRVPISRFLVPKRAQDANSFHGIVKSFCATTNLLTSSDSFQFILKIKSLLS